MASDASAAVRAAHRDDVQAVLDVHAQQGTRPKGPASQLERDTWDRMMGIAGLIVYVAEIDDAVVGTATAMMMPNVTYDCAPTVFIEAVVVLPEQRRRGIARAMMQKILTDARMSGCNKVQLLSHKRHARGGAHHLYTSMGFEPEAEGFRLYLTERPRRSASGLA